MQRKILKKHLTVLILLQFCASYEHNVWSIDFVYQTSKVLVTELLRHYNLLLSAVARLVQRVAEHTQYIQISLAPPHQAHHSSCNYVITRAKCSSRVVSDGAML